MIRPPGFPTSGNQYNPMFPSCMFKENTRAYLALAVVCVVWGTTYLAMRVGVTGFPAFLFSGLRHCTAALILWLVLPFLKKKFSFRYRDVIRQVIPGILMLGLGNGVIGWAEKYIPSGLAALIVSIMPLYVVVINFITGDGRDLNKKIVTGLLLGCVGIVLIFKDNLSDLGDARYFWGVIATFLASLAWAAGTIYMKKSAATTDPYINTALQLTSGGLSLILASFFLDDYSELQTVSSDSIWALVYLILFGSLLSYFCYLYAIRNLPVGLVAVYAYINPFIAVGLGFLILNEKVTPYTAIAFATTVTGVYFINAGYRKKKPREEVKDTAQAQTLEDTKVS